MVSGIILSKKSFNPEYAKKLSFIAYRIMDRVRKAKRRYKKFKTNWIQSPNPIYVDTISNDELLSMLKDRKRGSI